MNRFYAILFCVLSLWLLAMGPSRAVSAPIPRATQKGKDKASSKGGAQTQVNKPKVKSKASSTVTAGRGVVPAFRPLPQKKQKSQSADLKSKSTSPLSPQSLVVTKKSGALKKNPKDPLNSTPNQKKVVKGSTSSLEPQKKVLPSKKPKQSAVARVKSKTPSPSLKSLAGKSPSKTATTARASSSSSSSVPPRLVSSRNPGVETRARKPASQKEDQDSLQGLIAYLDQAEEGRQRFLADDLDELDLESQAEDEMLNQGVKTVRKDQTRFPADDLFPRND